MYIARGRAPRATAQWGNFGRSCADDEGAPVANPLHRSWISHAPGSAPVRICLEARPSASEVSVHRRWAARVAECAAGARALVFSRSTGVRRTAARLHASRGERVRRGTVTEARRLSCSDGVWRGSTGATVVFTKLLSCSIPCHTRLLYAGGSTSSGGRKTSSMTGIGASSGTSSAIASVVNTGYFSCHRDQLLACTDGDEPIPRRRARARAHAPDAPSRRLTVDRPRQSGFITVARIAPTPDIV